MGLEQMGTEDLERLLVGLGAAQFQLHGIFPEPAVRTGPDVVKDDASDIGVQQAWLFTLDAVEGCEREGQGLKRVCRVFSHDDQL